MGKFKRVFQPRENEYHSVLISLWEDTSIFIYGNIDHSLLVENTQHL